MGIHRPFHHSADHGNDAVPQVFAVQHTFSFAVDDLSLFIHDLVIFQEVFTDGKVVALHLFLGVFNGLGKHPRFNGLILCHAHGINYLHGPFGTKQAHQLILQGNIEPGFAGVPLTAGTASKLVIDTSGFMAFCADDLQPAQFFHAFAQLDVRTTAGHIGGDGNSASLARQRNDLRFLGMVFRIQHLMLDAFHFQHPAQLFGFINGDGANQYRLALFVCFLDLSDYSTEFARFCAVNHVLMVHSLYRLVGGDLHHVHAVNIAEFFFFRQCRTGHAAFLFVFVEVVLERNGGQGLAFSAHLHVFLGFNGLMQAVGISSAGHHTAGEFVNDNDLAFVDDIVLIPVHIVVGLQGVVDVMLDFQVVRVGKVVDGKEFFRLFHTFLGQHNGFPLFIQNIVAFLLNFFLQQGVHGFFLIQDAAFFQLLNEQVCHPVQVCGFGAAAGNDERRSGFVDQHRVHFVDDGKMQVSLHHVFFSYHHVVSQVVEAEFIVRTISDVAVVCRAALLVVHVVQNAAYGQPQETEHFPHPLGVTLGQIVIDCDHMHALAFQGIQIRGQSRHQRFAFTGSHFRDTALVHHDAAHKLYGEMAHVQHMGAGSRFPYHRIRFRQDVIQCLAIGQSVLEFLRFPSQFFIRKGFILGRQCFDLCHDRLDLLDFFFTVVPKDFFQKTHVGSPRFVLDVHVLKAYRQHTSRYILGTLLHYYSITEEYPRTQG